MFAIAPAVLFAFVLLRQKAHVVATNATPLAEKSIAVLPFENLSKEAENAFFAGGVQDELLSDLARIADLKVISRTSVMQYQDGRERNLREIGRTLGVANVVEGSVQRSGNASAWSSSLLTRGPTRIFGAKRTTAIRWMCSPFRLRLRSKLRGNYRRRFLRKRRPRSPKADVRSDGCIVF